MGGEILTRYHVEKVITDCWRVKAVKAVSSAGAVNIFEGDYFFSSAPVHELMRAFDSGLPKRKIWLA